MNVDLLGLLPNLARLSPWHWWILGALLLLLELSAPGILFVWLAAAAFVLGLLVFIVPFPVGAQLLLFAILALISVYVGRKYVGKLQQGSDPQADLLNAPGAGLIGRTFVVTDPIRNGVGRVKVGDSAWRARGPDVEAGAAVRVVRVEGATLVVELEGGEPPPPQPPYPQRG